MRIALAILLAVSVTVHAQDDPTVTCLGKLPANKKLTPIVSKLAVSVVTETTFPMLADQSRPNELEKRAIADWAAERNECVKAGDDYWRRTYPPQIHALAIEAENTLMALAVELYNGKVTFGEFNKRRQAASDESQNKMTAILQQMKTQYDAQQQSQRLAQQQAEQAQQAIRAQDDIARRQAATQILLNQMQMNQPKPLVPYQMPVRPTYDTNCYQVGNQLNCTTR